MNIRKFSLWIVFTLLLTCAACSPAQVSTPAPIAEAPQFDAGSQDEIDVPAAMPTWAAAEEEAGAYPPADNFFEDYGVNPETDAWEDHQSTFGLDVDTASYSVARRYLSDGYLPPYDAVRVEEFVNAFDQGYAAPQDAAFTIYADGARAPSGFEPGSVVLRFGVQGYEVDRYERKPVALTFVIDVSGSMAQENRLELVKRSLGYLVDQLDARDSVSIIVYGSDARAVLRPTPGDQKETILRAIRRLQPEGSTNAEAGLRLGYRYAAETFEEGAVNRVILCSDGVANVGATGPEEILSYVQGYVDEGITLTSIGVGMGNFNDVLLEQLADRGDGNYYYVDTPEEARKVFVDNLTGTLQVIARDAKVQVEFNPDVVESYRLLGYENRDVADEDFRNDAVDAGELGAGHTATAVYVVRLMPRAEGRLATVQLRWEDPDSSEVKEINGNFNTWDVADDFEETDAHFQLTVTVAQFAELLRESPYVYDLTYEELAWRADEIARQLRHDEQAAEFAQLVETAAEIGY